MTQIARIPTVSLKPLSPDLSPDVFTWANELRALFAATGLSISRFALMYPLIDKGTASRYLNGKRVPRDRWFLDTLIAVRDDAGKPLTPAAREHLTQLQLHALEAAHPHEYKLRKVTDELEIAVTGRREAERYARGIEEQLADRVRQIRELSADKERLRAAWDHDRAHMQALTREVADLTERLYLARERGVRAEHRCRQLEEVLFRLDAASDDRAIDEDGLGAAARVLALAQQTADQAIEESRREADELLDRARQEATNILGLARAMAAGITTDASRPDHEMSRAHAPR